MKNTWITRFGQGSLRALKKAIIGFAAFLAMVIVLAFVSLISWVVDPQLESIAFPAAMTFVGCCWGIVGEAQRQCSKV